jgi:hypothetical protein
MQSSSLALPDQSPIRNTLSRYNSNNLAKAPAISAFALVKAVGLFHNYAFK